MSRKRMGNSSSSTGCVLAIDLRAAHAFLSGGYDGRYPDLSPQVEVFGIDTRGK
jgi:hypothetical protein